MCGLLGSIGRNRQVSRKRDIGKKIGGDDRDNRLCLWYCLRYNKNRGDNNSYVVIWGSWAMMGLLGNSQEDI